MNMNVPTWLPQSAELFFVAGLVGLLGHFVSKRGRGEITVNLVQYLFIDTPGFTLATVLALVAATASAVAVGGLDGMSLQAQVASGFCAGWALDSGISKGR
jgi:uncharacterized membrane protein YGL010W